MSEIKDRSTKHNCTECKYSEMQCMCIWGNLRNINRILSGLYSHMDKLYNMINLDDRITGRDVLDRIEVLENNRKHSFHDRKELREITRNLHDRLSELEEWTRKDEDRVHERLNEFQNRLSSTEKDMNIPSLERLEFMEGWIDTLKNNIVLSEVFEENINNIHGRIDEIEKNYLINSAERIGHLGKALHCLSEENEKLRKVPHKCPVCKGSTFCDEGMECKVCEGSGVVWG